MGHQFICDCADNNDDIPENYGEKKIQGGDIDDEQRHDAADQHQLVGYRVKIGSDRRLAVQPLGPQAIQHVGQTGHDQQHQAGHDLLDNDEIDDKGRHDDAT